MSVPCTLMAGADAPLPVLLATKPRRATETWPEALSAISAAAFNPKSARIVAVVAAAVFVASSAIAAPQALGVFDAIAKWFPLILKGFAFDILVSVLSMAVGTIAGTLLGLAQISQRRPVRGVSWLITQFFRNAPWLVLLFYVMFLMPYAVRVGSFTLSFPDWIKAAIGLALPVMANTSEIVRGGVLSIPAVQWEAAEALALSRRQTLWLVILPQCLKRMLPPWMNLYAILIMATPIVHIVGVEEGLTMTKAALNAEAGRADLLLPFYGMLLVLFYVYCYPIARYTQKLEAKFMVKQ